MSSDIVNCSSNLQPSAHATTKGTCANRGAEERGKLTSGPVKRGASHLLIRPRDSRRGFAKAIVRADRDRR